VLPQGHRLGRNNNTVFFTPDIELRRRDGRRVPYRFILRVEGSDDSCPMWSGASVWSAETEIKDRPCTVTLRDGSMDGDFRAFGRTSVSLKPESSAADSTTRWSWSILSSIVCFDDGFKRLRFLGDESRADEFRLILEPYTNAIGELAPRVIGSTGDALSASWRYMRLEGESDPNVRFGLPQRDGAAVVPVGTYELSYAQVVYGKGTNASWSCQVSKYSGVAIGEDETCKLELGPPTLEVLAINADRRYSSDVKPATEFPREMTVYLSPKIYGPSGEEFARFAHADNERRKASPFPRMRIMDAGGSEVVTAKLEYG